jgi:hypothetical protein
MPVVMFDRVTNETFADKAISMIRWLLAMQFIDKVVRKIALVTTGWIMGKLRTTAI